MPLRQNYSPHYDKARKNEVMLLRSNSNQERAVVGLGPGILYIPQNKTKTQFNYENTNHRTTSFY